MAKHSYLITLHEDVTASTTHTFTIRSSNDVSLAIYGLYQQSDGDFQIEDMSHSAGYKISDATPSNPLNQLMIPDAAGAIDNVLPFPEPLMVSGGEQLEITVKDLSGSNNDIRFLLPTVRETGI